MKKTLALKHRCQAQTLRLQSLTRFNPLLHAATCPSIAGPLRL